MSVVACRLFTDQRPVRAGLWSQSSPPLASDGRIKLRHISIKVTVLRTVGEDVPDHHQHLTSSSSRIPCQPLPLTSVSIPDPRDCDCRQGDAGGSSDPQSLVLPLIERAVLDLDSTRLLHTPPPELPAIAESFPQVKGRGHLGIHMYVLLPPTSCLVVTRSGDAI